MNLIYKISAKSIQKYQSYIVKNGKVTVLKFEEEEEEEEKEEEEEEEEEEE